MSVMVVKPMEGEPDRPVSAACGPGPADDAATSSPVLLTACTEFRQPEGPE